MLKINHMINIPVKKAEYPVKVINKEYGKQNQASAKNYYIYVHILVRARAITCAFKARLSRRVPAPTTY